MNNDQEKKRLKERFWIYFVKPEKYAHQQKNIPFKFSLPALLLNKGRLPEKFPTQRIRNEETSWFGLYLLDGLFSFSPVAGAVNIANILDGAH